MSSNPSEFRLETSAEGARPTRLVLFDGHCGVCSWAVQWTMLRDKHGAIHFAPLQSALGQRIVARHPDLPEELDSLILVEDAEGIALSDSSDAAHHEQVYYHSEGMFQMLAALPAPWSLLRVGRLLPKFLADGCYRFFTRHRYRIVARRDQCMLPTPAQRERFLDF